MPPRAASRGSRYRGGSAFVCVRTLRAYPAGMKSPLGREAGSMREFRYFEAPGLAMLRRLVLAAVAALVLAAPASAGTTVAAATFVFSGHGWGHGIGLSQYGALGYAQHGSTYTQIVSHYYPGTQLGPAPARSIRVLLADTKKVVTVSSGAGFRVKD